MELRVMEYGIRINMELGSTMNNYEYSEESCGDMV